VVGAELAPAHVSIRVPANWAISTGLTPTSDARTYFASNAEVLVGSPILVGRLSQHWFSVHGVPHQIAHWIAPNAPPFDTMTFIDGVERLANEAVRLFGRAPYREYVFQFQDNAYGGLENYNSVTIGLPSADLARDPHAMLQAVLRGPATATREAAALRFHPRRPPRASYDALPLVAGQLALLGGAGEPSGVQLAPRRARGL